MRRYAATQNECERCRGSLSSPGELQKGKLLIEQQTFGNFFGDLKGLGRFASGGEETAEYGAATGRHAFGLFEGLHRLLERFTVAEAVSSEGTEECDVICCDDFHLFTEKETEIGEFFGDVRIGWIEFEKATGDLEQRGGIA